MSIVGILPDDADPMVSVMKVEKAPLESYADIGGLHEQVYLTYVYIYVYGWINLILKKLSDVIQIQEIKEAVELPLTHPELYEEIGIKPPKGKCDCYVCMYACMHVSML